jgi:hypothetical protein
VRVAGVTGANGTPYTLAAAKRTNRDMFIAPAGSDTNPGTFAAPLQHFTVAVGKLQPGDTLVLLDGTYTVAQNGAFGVHCDTAASGSADPDRRASTAIATACSRHSRCGPPRPVRFRAVPSSRA